MKLNCQNYFLHYLGTGLLVAVLIMLASCGGGNRSAVPAAGSSGDENQGRSILAQGEKPVSIPDASPREGGVPLTVHLWDGGSYDLDGEIVKWEWKFGDTAPGEPAWQDYTASVGDAWHTYSNPGHKAALLRVTDNDGKRDVGLVRIVMTNDGNANPVAVPSADTTVGHAPLTVNFSAAGSYDPDGTITSYEWDFGEGFGYEPASAADGGSTHVFENEGVYTVILRVTDDDGAVSTDCLDISVLAPSNIWSMLGREQTHTARSPYIGPTTNALKWIWSADTYSGISSSPVIGSDGTIYVGTVDSYGGSQWGFHAIKPDGTLKWTFPTDGNVRNSAAVGPGGTIYFGGNEGTGDWSGRLFALDPDGSLKWKYVTRFAPNSPTVDSAGTIYMIVGDTLEVIDNSGSFQWKFKLWGSVTSGPAIAPDGTVYTGSTNDYFWALSPDGTPKWNYWTGGDIHGSAAIGDDGSIYFGSLHDKRVHALNPDGSLQWTYSTIGGVADHLAISIDGTIYAADNFGYLHAINPDGTQRWVYDTDSSYAPIVDANGTVFQRRWNHLIAIDQHGTLKWSYPVSDYQLYTSPAMGNDGTIYVGAQYWDWRSGYLGPARIYAIGPGEGI